MRLVNGCSPDLQGRSKKQKQQESKHQRLKDSKTEEVLQEGDFVFTVNDSYQSI